MVTGTVVVVGATVEGEVKNKTEFGLFISLEGEIDGMVHLSDLARNKSGDEAIAGYKKGDMVKAKVLDVDLEKERISLGIKQMSKDPVAVGFANVKKGDLVTCTVTAVVDNGIEVKVKDSVPGFIRKSALSRDRSEQRPDRFAPGEKVDAKITQVDKSGRRLTLSIKAHEVEEEKRAMATYGSSNSGASLGDILGAAIQEKQEATRLVSAEKQAKTESADEPESEGTSAKKTAKKVEDVAEKKTAAKKPAQKAGGKAKDVAKKKPVQKANDVTKKKPAVKKSGDAKGKTKKKPEVKKSAAKDDK